MVISTLILFMVFCILIDTHFPFPVLYCRSMYVTLTEGIPVGSMYLYFVCFGHWVMLLLPRVARPLFSAFHFSDGKKGSGPVSIGYLFLTPPTTMVGINAHSTGS